MDAMVVVVGGCTGAVSLEIGSSCCECSGFGSLVQMVKCIQLDWMVEWGGRSRDMVVVVVVGDQEGLGSMTGVSLIVGGGNRRGHNSGLAAADMDAGSLVVVGGCVVVEYKVVVGSSEDNGLVVVDSTVGERDNGCLVCIDNMEMVVVIAFEI